MVWLKILSRSSVQSDANCVCFQFLNPVPSTLVLHRMIFSVTTQILALCSASVHWVILEAPFCTTEAPSRAPNHQEITPNPDTFLAVPYRAKNSCHVFLCKNQPVMLIKAQHKRRNPNNCEWETVIFKPVRSINILPNEIFNSGAFSYSGNINLAEI